MPRDPIKGFLNKYFQQFGLTPAAADATAVATKTPYRPTVGAAGTQDPHQIPTPLGHAEELNPVKRVTPLDVLDLMTGLRTAGKAGYALGQAVHDRNPGAAAGALAATLPMMIPGEGKLAEDVLPKEWAVLTAENPFGQSASEAENAAHMAAARKYLDAKGIKYQPVSGGYRDETTGQVLRENGFLLPGTSPAQAENLGRRFHQNSVVTHRGLHDLVNNSLIPSQGLVSATEDSPAFTILPSGKGFAHELDWDHPQPLKAAADSTVAHSPIAQALLKDSPYAWEYGMLVPDAEATKVSTPMTPRELQQYTLSHNLRQEGEPSGLLSALADSLTTKVLPSAAKFQDTPEQVRERLAAAWQKVREPVPADRPAPLGLIDRSMVQPDPGPTQAPLPQRPAFGPRAASGQLAGVSSDENRALMAAQAQRGLQMMPQTFYPSVQAVLDAIGNSGGDPALFNHATTAAAIRNSVPGEIVGGTAMQWGLKNGILDLDELNDLAKQGGKAPFQGVMDRLRQRFAQQFPDANGLQLMNIHGDALRKRLMGIEPGSFKIPMYGAQKLADVPGSVLDTHESHGSTLASPYHRFFEQEGGFSPAEYGYMEPIYRDIAQSLGLSDRGFQEARWRGGGNITGLATPPNLDYAQIFESLLDQNARHRNVSPQQLLKDVATGKTALYIPKRR